jgi:hypothetical protein
VIGRSWIVASVRRQPRWALAAWVFVCADLGIVAHDLVAWIG